MTRILNVDNQTRSLIPPPGGFQDLLSIKKDNRKSGKKDPDPTAVNTSQSISRSLTAMKRRRLLNTRPEFVREVAPLILSLRYMCR